MEPLASSSNGFHGKVGNGSEKMSIIESNGCKETSRKNKAKPPLPYLPARSLKRASFSDTSISSHDTGLLNLELETLSQKSKKDVVSKDGEKDGVVKGGKKDVTLKEGGKDGVVKEGKKDGVLKEGEKGGVVKEGKKDSVVKKGKKDGVVKEGKKDGVLKEGEKDGVVKEGKKDSVLKEGEKDGVVKEGKKDGVLKEGEKDGVVKEGEKDGVLKEGEKDGVVKEGKKDGVLKEGEKDGVVKEGEKDGVSEGEKDDDDVKQESSPRGVSEDCSTSTESETAPSTSTSDSEVQPVVPWRDYFRAFTIRPSKHIQTFRTIKKPGPRLTRIKTKRIREELVPVLSTSSMDGADIYCLKSSWRNFSLSEIQTATNNFGQENLIGEGGYAEVYKGELTDGQIVAIKRLIRGSSEEMTIDFLSELGIMAHVDHPNIAKVIGYGVDGGMHLILQLSVHGSLASLLYGPKEKLDYATRFKIALGTALGLQYLHEGCQRRIIHKDIKASNILLSEDFEAQISDFGLAKWLPDKWTHHTVSKIEGTFGYLPPEFFMHGIVDEKTDVYAYGVLVLELITGKQAIDSSQHSLVMWAKPLLMKNSVKELVDPTLADAYDEKQMEFLVFTASSCIHQASMLRPQMNQVIEMLRGNEQVLEEVHELQNPMLQRTYSEELFDAEEYNSTKHLSDLTRQMEMILDCDDEI
ncbi:receptor-like cytosolic serine/threonine-protein kinase RBK2 isoform X2 [Euphorbia lathyris]|uniref:receptor-like cytosolic serine/threonine-protein kinase RBK2 isoform X2 n=1 Tax=Euphorbia lathyris TaxID=212925 RepID=UPI00331394E7